MAQVPGETVQALLDGLSEGVLAVDPAGEIRLLNGAMAQLLGAAREELLSCRPAELEARGMWLPPVLRRCLESGQRQALVLERSGRRLALTAAPLPLGWVVATARDITELDRLERQVERMTQERERFHHELAGLRSAQAGRPEVVSSSLAMQRVLELIRRVAQVDSTVLLLGESGVGKGVLAAEIHRQSRRAAAPFVRIDCAALPESLLESELFGYLPGSFTGARREGKPGLIEQANGGTLFIDEIGDVPLGLQVKLLHVIQERRITRVGAVTPTPVDIRIVAATHRDLEALVAEGRFRADLYYRLNVVPVTIPPLRERPEDIPVLARAFLDRFCARYRVERTISPEAMARLMAHHWPGNVRELENLMERLVVTLEEREIRPEHLPLPAPGGPPVQVREIVPLKEAVAALELELVGEAYKRYGSSVKVSRVLGIHQTTAARKIREWKARRGGVTDGAGPRVQGAGSG
ncbi:sigma-54 interaction domain-containing protein [Symbiobacterium terraclitae]|uniref:sigma-54 interaction domain-containing protein n=1 Tax=Symbiobacterium terraclitae TaxID=557451 RepID=UPI0035B55FA6